MPVAAAASLHLARFDQLREAGSVTAAAMPGVLFCGVAADTRAAGTEPASQLGFTFLILGLHADVSSARRFVEERGIHAGWLDKACETWSAVLQPFRHHGAANYLDPARPGVLFDETPATHEPDVPVVAMTTAGWNRDGLDMNRVREFSTGVLAVRTSMTGVPGLHTQHSFFFPGVLDADPLTLTFWRDEASIRNFAYGQGSHRRQLDRHRAETLADRTSFTRFRAVYSAGSWHGHDPVRPRAV